MSRRKNIFSGKSSAHLFNINISNAQTNSDNEHNNKNASARVFLQHMKYSNVHGRKKQKNNSSSAGQ
jgi:hypothetical protein